MLQLRMIVLVKNKTTDFESNLKTEYVTYEATMKCKLGSGYIYAKKMICLYNILTCGLSGIILRVINRE